MTKIVYNNSYGGFRLSEQAVLRGREISKHAPIWEEDSAGYMLNLPRTDPVLVQVVEELGAAANGGFANLQIHVLPRGTRYRIDEYDGNERVMIADDYEWSIA